MGPFTAAKLPPARGSRFSRTARYYSKTAELARKPRGVMPVAPRKAREKFDWEEKPVDHAISDMGRWRFASICFASASRIWLTNSCGHWPVVALNERAKCAGLMQ